MRKENRDADKMLRDIEPVLFEPDKEDCYKAIRIGNALVAITLNMKVMEIMINLCQLKNIFMKLSRI